VAGFLFCVMAGAVKRHYADETNLGNFVPFPVYEGTRAHGC
jgi:hypothetical protein